MNKIKIIVLLLTTCFFCGCRDDEIIEIIESDTLTESENVVKEANNEQTAESIDTDDSQPFVVYVTGEVNNPGVFELKETERVIDAIDAAGGYTEKAGINYLNLASPITDGQMIYVPSIEEIENGNITNLTLEATGTGQYSESGTNGGLININAATKEELMTLPGIGESKADKIISYREENGKFSSPEGIMEISGIKEGLYNKIKDSICAK